MYKETSLNDASINQQLSPEFVLSRSKAAAVCLHDRGKKSGVNLDVIGHLSQTICIKWDELTKTDFNSYADMQDATEWGAEAIAFIVISDFTDYNIIKKSSKGTGFDYMLSNSRGSLFQNELAKLEVSGILELHRESELQARTAAKLNQATKHYKDIPVFVIVTAFSVPKSEVIYASGN